MTVSWKHSVHVVYANSSGASVSADAWNADLSHSMATDNFLGRRTAGSGPIEEISPTQATAMLNQFTVSLKGLVPFSGGGSVNFLRADGIWAVPVMALGDDTVTFAKMQNLTGASKLVGRGAAGGAGDPEEITLGTNMSMSGTVLSAAYQTGHVASDFARTSSTALTDVTGLTANVVSGRTYRFEATLFTTSNVAGGIKVAVGGTATATAIVAEAIAFDVANTTEPAQTRVAALAAAMVAVTALTVAHVKISGVITVNAGGTLTIQFGQNASSGSASTVLRGSNLIVHDIT